MTPTPSQSCILPFSEKFQNDSKNDPTNQVIDR